MGKRKIVTESRDYFVGKSRDYLGGICPRITRIYTNFYENRGTEGKALRAFGRRGRRPSGTEGQRGREKTGFRGPCPGMTETEGGSGGAKKRPARGRPET